MSSAVVVQHLESEGPAAIAAQLAARGVDVSVVRPDLGDPVPRDLDEILGRFAALVASGHRR